MAMDRDELLRRLVTAAEFIENKNLTPRTLEAAKKRYDELEAEFWRLNEQEKTFKPPVPEHVQQSMETIRSILKPERPKREGKRSG